MHQIKKRVVYVLNRPFVYLFLVSKHVKFDGLPAFSGYWPDINNEGCLVIGLSCGFRAFRLRHRITVHENAELVIGHSSFLNDGVAICSTKSIRIGHHAKIGDMVYIYDTDFHEVSPDRPIKQAPVSIGNNVWIGAKSIILPGSIIGDHSVIAAGSIVNSRIPEKALAAGSPAKVIKLFDVPDGWVRK